LWALAAVFKDSTVWYAAAANVPRLVAARKIFRVETATLVVGDYPGMQ
jgi:hypothetical protein